LAKEAEGSSTADDNRVCSYGRGKKDKHSYSKPTIANRICAKA